VGQGLGSEGNIWRGLKRESRFKTKDTRLGLFKVEDS